MTASDPAGELRSAAALMRKRAGEATPGPWERPLDTRHRNVVGAALPEGEAGRFTDGLVPDYMTSGYLGRYRGQRERVGVVSCNISSDGSFYRKRSGRDLEYIASMHPGVALALADWLEATAKQADDEIADLDGPFCHRCGAHLKCPDPRECCGVVLGRCHCWDGALATARAYLGTDAR